MSPRSRSGGRYTEGMSQAGGFASTIALLRGAKAGDRDALSKLLERYRPILSRRIHWMMGGNARMRAETGDFLHGVFLEILRRLDRFEIRDERSFVAWATEIARNSIRSLVNRKYERAFSSLATTMLGVEPAASPTPSENAASAEQRHRLAEAIEQLAEDYQQAILLRHMEGLSFAEIAERMARSENAVQLLHARALGRLSALVGD